MPGALAGALPGGAAYVGPQRVPANLEAVVAADHGGRVGRVSLGPASTLAGRVRAELRAHPMVVALLPPGPAGDRALDDLIDARGGGQLLVVVRRPPRSATAQLLPVGIAGLRADAGLLSSRTTRRAGLVAGTDLLPTVLGWLGEPVPPGVQGRPVTVTGARDAAALGDLERRLRVVSPRRLPVLGALAAAIAAAGLLLAVGLGSSGRRPSLCSPWASGGAARCSPRRPGGRRGPRHSQAASRGRWRARWPTTRAPCCWSTERSCSRRRSPACREIRGPRTSARRRPARRDAG